MRRHKAVSVGKAEASVRIRLLCSASREIKPIAIPATMSTIGEKFFIFSAIVLNIAMVSIKTKVMAYST